MGDSAMPFMPVFFPPSGRIAAEKPSLCASFNLF